MIKDWREREEEEGKREREREKERDRGREKRGENERERERERERNLRWKIVSNFESKHKLFTSKSTKYTRKCTTQVSPLHTYLQYIPSLLFIVHLIVIRTLLIRAEQLDGRLDAASYRKVNGPSLRIGKEDSNGRTLLERLTVTQLCGIERECLGTDIN